MGRLYLACKNLAVSNPVIIPFIAVNIRFSTSFGVITGSFRVCILLDGVLDSVRAAARAQTYMLMLA